MRESSRTRFLAVSLLAFSVFFAFMGFPLFPHDGALNSAYGATDKTNPAVRISSPLPGATLPPGSFVVYGTASDNTGGSGLKNVWLKTDAGRYLAVTPLAAGDWSTWTFPVTITALGSHSLTAKATDKAGNSKWHSISINIESSPPPDTTPPTVSASPPGGSYLDSVDVTISAIDDTDPSPTIYYTLDGTDPTTSSPAYSGPLEIISTTTLKFIAKDAASNTSPVGTEAYTINVDSVAPSISIESPADGSTMGGTELESSFVVSGTSSDDLSGILAVSLRIDGANYLSATPYAPGDWSAWTIPVTIFASGPHTLTAKATDKSGNANEHSVTVNIELGASDQGDDIPAPLRVVNVDTIDSLMTAISSAIPGDHIILKDGVYDDSAWLSSNSVTTLLVRNVDGTAANPIVITSETIGGAELTGPAGFRFYDVSHVIIKGFKFTHSQDNSIYSDDIAIQCDLCNYVRFTRNHFELATSTNISSDWLGITSDLSDYNRIDHNIFKNKNTKGVFLFIFGDNGDMAKYNTVDHNYFYNQYYSGGNGGECMRIGNSERGLKNAYTTVEYNLFEKCMGDVEAVTVKASSNTFRANTFRDNTGSLTFRHGNNNVADGNFFLNGKGGIRSYGHDHTIINNYFQGLSGTGSLISLVIGSGTVEEDLSYSNSMHSRSKNVLVAFNTFYDNQNTYMRIGENFRTLHPQDITVAHNVLVGNSGTLVNFDEGDPIYWIKNILYGSASKGSMPASGYTIIDPQLTLGPTGIMGLSSTSPAIDQASESSYPSVATDIDGQTRSDPKDTGADEFSIATAVSKPLTPSDVGPQAP